MNCIKYFWRLLFALVTRNSAVFLVFFAVTLCVTVLAELYVTQFLCKIEIWHEAKSGTNENFVIWYPEGNMTLIFSIDKEKYPADWHCYVYSMESPFYVSGYGHSGSDGSYGSLFYQSRYNWVNNRVKMKVFDSDISIYRGKSIVIGGCSFQIDKLSPLIIQIGKDGSPQALSDYPVEVLPRLKELNAGYIWEKYKIPVCSCPGVLPGNICFDCCTESSSDSESGVPIE
jgi:hypothetical protein